MNGYIFNVIIYIRYIYNMMYHKYIKYKTKYLNMKSQQSGGAVIFKQNNIDDHMMINVNDKNNIPIYEHLNLHYTLEQKNDIRFVIDNVLPCMKKNADMYYGSEIILGLDVKIVDVNISDVKIEDVKKIAQQAKDNYSFFALVPE